MSADVAYPLAWPHGWPRTQYPQRSKFGDRSVHAAVEELKHQLSLLKATDMVISSNVTLGATPKDKGVCVYFKLKGKPYALPCDKWDCPEDNLWALAKHIENMRAQDRWGVGNLERAFAGYMALPAPAGENAAQWWDVLRVPRNCDFDTAQAAYRSEARIRHPDNGGSNEKMATLNQAWANAKLAFGR